MQTYHFLFYSATFINRKNDLLQAFSLKNNFFAFIKCIFQQKGGNAQ